MSAYIALRKDFGEAFGKKHEIKLGFKSGNNHWHSGNAVIPDSSDIVYKVEVVSCNLEHEDNLS